jgi:SHS2 domain-containing protein
MSLTRGRFEEVEHVADSALRVYGNDWSELLRNAALGMFSLIATWDEVLPLSEDRISLHSLDAETLLVDWLSELLYLHEMRGLVYVDFDIIEASANSLEAIARGTERWTPRTAIKAVTFNDLHIATTADGYTATIVFDT